MVPMVVRSIAMKTNDVTTSTAEVTDLLDVIGGTEEPSVDNIISGNRVREGGSDNRQAPAFEREHDTSGTFDDEEVDPSKGTSFSRPGKVPGEKLIPLSQLKEWAHHPAKGSRTRGNNTAGLIASAIDPANIPPIVILPAEGGLHPIQDGRLRWHALKEAHGDNSGIQVRCVMFSGTEAEAVQAACDDALGSTPRSPIEVARSILNVQRVAGISQKAIAERYSVLKKDQVSRMTIAAKTVERFPTVFNLLEEPDRVSIDLCVKFAQFMKTASDHDRAAVLEAAETHESAGASLKRNELFEALGIETDEPERSAAKSDPLDPIDSTEIFGSDDQPVGAMEMLSDEVMRLRLPDPTTMTADEREAAAAAFIEQIRAYFGLDARG